jgi:hypothetical protein
MLIPDPKLGIQLPEILLPAPGLDLTKWAVIACDQFTSEPDYWAEVDRLVGEAPSTLRLVLPEVFLGGADEAARIQSIRQHMSKYLSGQVLVPHRGPILVERSVAGRTRHGLMLALDLEQYDFRSGSTSLIRATEGTIVERIPPRVRIRSGAPLELPHILVLIDDPECSVIEPLVAQKQSLPRLYDFELMQGSGHVTGFSVGADADLAPALLALEKLADPSTFQAKYGLAQPQPVLLFAMGDGNHSLATAKSLWDQLKTVVGMDHPARFALVEIENIHDSGLIFEPILRVLFGVKANVTEALAAHYPKRCQFSECASLDEMVARVDAQQGGQSFGILSADGYQVATVAEPPSNLPVGTLQQFLDAWGKQGGYQRIDYVHGENVCERLGRAPGNLGFYVPGFSKSDFFKTVIVDGALPRKTFSMGEAREKRFYLEARRIA